MSTTEPAALTRAREAAAIIARITMAAERLRDTLTAPGRPVDLSPPARANLNAAAHTLAALAAIHPPEDTP